MQRIHVPTGGLRYWVALCTASVLGCNTGDGFASIFGFLSGLPILLALFGLTLFLERRDDRPRQIYYWTAIIIVRTAATNLADFTDQHLRNTAFLVLGLAGASLVLSIVVAGLIGLGSGVRLFSFSLYYWATVVAIRTAGTSAGDYFARIWGLPESTLVFAVILVALLALWPERPRAVQPSLQPGMGAA